MCVSVCIVKVSVSFSSPSSSCISEEVVLIVNRVLGLLFANVFCILSFSTGLKCYIYV